MTLSPCPFCGATDEDLVMASSHYRIECLDCNCHGPICDNEDDAITEWNRRHDPKRHEDKDA